MVRADEAVNVPRRRGTNERTTMAADVVETAYDTVFAPDDNEGVSVDLQRKIIARPQSLATMPGKEPAATPDPIQIGAINNFIRVKLARQRMARLMPGEQRIDQVRCVRECRMH